MDDGDGGLSFDFEGGLDTGPAHPTASVPVIQSSADVKIASGRAGYPNNLRWTGTGGQAAEGMGGGAGGASADGVPPLVAISVHERRCLWVPSSVRQVSDACLPIFSPIRGVPYKLGFCPNGPDCRYRHAKLPGPPPPVEEVLQKIQQLASYNHGNTNKFFQNRNTTYTQQTEKSQLPQGPSAFSAAGQPGSNTEFTPNGQQIKLVGLLHTLPQGTSRYFVVKSCNRENLELSVQQGVWATQRSNEAKLNEAFESVENVILIFSVNKTRHFQGCAKMTSTIGGSVGGGNWKHAHGTAHYGRNFAVKWLKISRDCQELEPSIGEQLASLLYLEPDSDLMAVSLAAELKREEEKAKGVNLDNGTENPDIVPFEDNEEEEEEESEEEDESPAQVFGAQGRGRGRGMMWPPHMPLARGARPFPGIRGFPPNMMSGDGFSYGPVNPDGFPMPDPFGMAPRGFGPYGPRFSGDFAGLPLANECSLAGLLVDLG
ncbi:cleavage and polyadenylation specificity factor 30 [Sesamum alatum]|uniref:YTH domain-containing family protein n=1 Tax=Sesamum alatum TaxID=300844 RepID=A0AAE1Y0R0_9LAMI|nr:cleavage and polyadenylation specificity factor 30 [Sesamum alatum]